MNKIPRSLIVLIQVLILAACSSTTLRDDETETFSPRISADGSKLFTYQLDTPSGGLSTPRLVFDANENKDMNTAPEMAPYSAEDEKRRIEIRVIALLEQKIAASAYCQDGYVLSKRTIGFTRSVLTGECRETATAEDQRRFGGKNAPTP